MLCHVSTRQLCFLYMQYNLSYSSIYASPGPDFGSPSFTRRNLVSILHEKGKACSIVDDIAIVKRYSDGSCNSIPVSSDDEALSKTIKEVGIILNESFPLLI